jgi:hypothetical protein
MIEVRSNTMSTSLRLVVANAPPAHSVTYTPVHADHMQDKLSELEREKRVAVHHAIIQGHVKRGVVYISRMKQVTHEWYIIKIGWSDDVESRDDTLTWDFGTHYFVHIVDVIRPRAFEKYLKAHEDISKYQDRTHYNSTETYLVTDEIYERFKAIIARDLPAFDTLDRRQELRLRYLLAREDEKKNVAERIALDKAALEHKVATDNHVKEVLEASLKKAEDHFAEVFEMFKSSPREVHMVEIYKHAKELVLAARSAYENNFTLNHDKEGTDQPSTIVAQACPVAPEGKRKFKNYIQKYDPDTLELLAVYEGPNDAVNKLGEGASQPLTDAARNKTKYCGFRWAEVSKASKEDPNVPRDIGETAATKECHGGYVARLSEDLKTVMDVYPSQSDAAEQTGRTPSAVCAMLKKTEPGRESSRWIRWSKVSEDMQAAYLEHRSLPALPTRNGRAVLQLDSKTKEILARHETAAKVIRLFGVGTQSIKDACDGKNPSPLKGFCWKWAEDATVDDA